MMPSAECAAGIDDEGVLPGGGSAGSYRVLTKKRPAMTGSRPAWLIVTQSSSPSGSRLCGAPSALSAPIRATATAHPVCPQNRLRVAIHPGRLSSGSRVIRVGGGSRPSVSTSSSPIASRLVAGAGQVSFQPVMTWPSSLSPAGVEALVPGLGISGTGRGGERFRAGQPLEHTTSARMRRQQEIASKCRDPSKVERNTAIKAG